MKTKYQKLGCEFMNESECQEVADEEGESVTKLDKENFDDD